MSAFDAVDGSSPPSQPVKVGRMEKSALRPTGATKPYSRLQRLIAVIDDPDNGRAPKIAAVALANKMARMIWAMMVTGSDIESPWRLRSNRQRRTGFGKGNRDVMYHRSKPRAGKPICAIAPRPRAFGRDPS